MISSDSISYINGDITKPIGDDDKILIHCCNDIGKMGSGVALAIANKWPLVKTKYIQWFNSSDDFALGSVQIVKVDSNIYVGNMIAQKGIKIYNNKVPIRYDAMSKCLERISTVAKKNNLSVHLPYRMGSDRAGGDWNKIESLIEKQLTNNAVNVIVYKFNQ